MWENQSSVIDILFSVTVSDDPFADGLFLTNQARTGIDSTNNISQVFDAIIRFTLREPVLAVTKGIVSTTNPAAAYSTTPTTDIQGLSTDPPGNPPFTPPLTPADIDSGYDANVSGVDIGDTVRFVSTIVNTGGAPAYDILLQDTLPAGVTCDNATVDLRINQGNGTAIGFTSPNGGAASACDLFGAGIRLVDPTTGAVGDSGAPGNNATDPTALIILTYDLNVTSGTIGDMAENTFAVEEFYSLDGSSADPTKNQVTAPIEDTAELQVISQPVKLLVTTSEEHTSASNVTIGEIVRYRIYTTVPEGVQPNLQLRDAIPAGMQYLNDGTTTYGFEYDANFTSSTVPATPGQQVSGNPATTPLTAVLPASAVAGGPFSNGTDVTFRFGDVTNSDNDNDSVEYIIVEFNAIVTNVVTNQSFDNATDQNISNTALDNTFSVLVDRGGSETLQSTSDPVRVTVVEPNVILAKTISANQGDAGDAIRYTLTVTSNGEASAFDVLVLDDLATLFPDYDLTAVNTSQTGGASGITNNSNLTADTVSVSIADMPVGSVVTITVDGTIRNTIQPGAVFTNQATLTFTSLPGTGTASNPTGSMTPGASGAADGERAGNGGSQSETVPNNYIELKSIDFSSQAPTVVKAYEPGSSNDANTPDTPVPPRLTIGEEFSYLITVTLPEGTTRDVFLLDQAEPTFTGQGGESIQLLSAEIIAVGANLSNTGTPVGTFIQPVGTTFTINTDNSSFTSISGGNGRGDILNTPDGVVNAADRVVVRVRARIDNLSANVNGDVASNRAQLKYDNRAGAEQTLNSQTDVRIVEPNLTIAKSVTPTAADSGDTVTYTITVANTGTAPAYDLSIDDTLPDDITFGAVDNATSTCDNRAGYVANTGNPTSTYTFNNLLQGQNCTIVYTATIDVDANPDAVLVNNAGVGYSSRPGTPDDDRTYETTTTASVTITGLEAVKSIVSTSETHTPDTSADTTSDPRPVAVGEVIRYRLVTTVAEATSPNVVITDVLAPSIGFIAGSADVSYSADNTFSGSGSYGTNQTTPTTLIVPAYNTTTNTLTFTVGQVVNNDNDADDELLIIEFNAFVRNTAANVTAPTAAKWANRFSVDSGNGGEPEATSNDVFASVLEPKLTVVKTASPTTADAGDIITFTVTVSNTGNTTAFDVSVADTLDSRLSLVSVSTPTAPAYYSETSTTAQPQLNRTITAGGGGSFNITFNRLDAADSVTYTVVATVLASVNVADTIDNTVDVLYTSLPGPSGTAGNPTGDTAPDASGETTGERDGSNGAAGSPNNYAASDTLDTVVTIAGAYDTVKSIDLTSEAHTGDGSADTAGDPRPVAVGEVIRYRLVSTLPEATSPNVVITDVLASNIRFIAGSARISYQADAAFTGGGTYGNSEVNPTTTITPAVTGNTLAFNVGEVVNNDNDAGGETLIIEFNVVVLNTATNTAGVTWPNNFTLNVNGGAVESTSNNVSAQVKEPSVTIDKSINTTLSTPTGTTTFEAGDTVVYDIVVTAGSGGNTATAFDLSILDTFNADVVINGVTFVGIPAGTTPTDNTSGNDLAVILSQLQPGETITIRVSTTVANTVTPAEVVDSTSSLTYTSLPGTGGTTGNPTGSDTPGASGAVDGERNGSDGATGTPNNYADSDNAPFTAATGFDLTKSVDLSDATIGDAVTYTLLLELIEGTTEGVTIVDTLPDNLDFIAGSVTVSTPAGGSTGYVDEATSVTSADPTLTIRLGDVVVPSDGDDTNDRVTVTFRARVMNTAANADGQTKTNSATATSDNGTPANPADDVTSTSTADTDIIEPALTISKTGDDTTGDGGDIITYTVVVSHITASSNLNAYDVVVQDLFSDPNLEFVNAADGAVAPTAVTTGGGTATITTGLGAGDTTLRVDLNVLELTPAATLTVTYQARIIAGVAAGIAIENDAFVRYDTQNNNDATEERVYQPTDNTDEGEELVDNHIVTTTSVGASKSVESVSPDLGSAQGSSSLPDVTIGGSVTYRVVVEVPEGSNTIVLTDTLPTGMEPVSARVVAFNGPITSSSLAVNDAEDSSDTQNPNINYGGGTSRTVTFDFATLSNTPNGGGTDTVEVEVVAQLTDVAGNAAGATKTNSAVLTVNGTDGDPVTADIDVVEPGISLTKTFTPDEQVRGQYVRMTLVISNPASATAPLYDVDVIDVLNVLLDITDDPADPDTVAITFDTTNAPTATVTNNSVFASGYATPDEVSVNIDRLGIGESVTILVDLRIDPSTPTLNIPQTFTNTATATGDSLPADDGTVDGRDRDLTTDASDDLSIVKPTLLVTKSDSADPVVVGQPYSYTISVSNTGTPDYAATGVVFTDLLPTGFIVTRVTPSQGSCQPLSGTMLTCNLGTIAQGNSASVTVAGRSSSTLADGTVLSNTAYVTSVEGNNGNDGNDTPDDDDDERAVETTTVSRSVDIQVTKVVNDPTPNEADLVTYTIRTRNNGPSQATSVVMTDVLPAGLTFVRFTPTTAPCSYTAASRTLQCTYGVLAANQTRTVGVEVRVDAGTSGSTIANTANVTANETETNTANNSSTVSITIDRIDLTVSIAVTDATPNEGDTLVYTINVINNGPGNATNVIADTDLDTLFGSALTYLSDNSLTITDSRGNPVTFDPVTGVLDIPALDAGGSVQLQVTVQLNPNTSGNSYTTNVTVVADQSDVGNDDDPADPYEDETNNSNNVDDVTILVGGVDLELSKAISDTAPSQGDTVVYTIAVRNVSRAIATGVVVTDNLPSAVTYVSDNSATTGTTYNSGTGVWTVGTVNPGQVRRLRITVTVDAEPIESFTNIAEITAMDQADVDSTPGNGVAGEDDQASVTATVARIDMQVGITVDNPTPAPGGQVVYTVTIRNNGPGDATGIVSDTDLETLFAPGGPLDYVSDNGTTLVDSNGNPVTFDPATGVISFADLDAGGSVVLRITASVKPDATGVFPTNVTVVADQSDVGSFNPANPYEDETNDQNNVDSTQIAIAQPDLTIDKSHRGNFAVGTPGTFTLRVRNAGNGATTGAITVTDMVPAELTLVSASGTNWNCTITGQTLSCTYSAIPLAAGATASDLIVTVNPNTNTGSPFTNTADVTTPGESNTTNNSDDDPVSVTAGVEPDLEIVKSHTGNFVTNQNGTFTLRVSNAGTAAVTTGPITVTDTLPAGLTYVSASGTSWTCIQSSPGVVTCSYTGSFPVNGGATLPDITLTVRAPSSTGSPFTNSVTVATAGDNNPTNDTDTDEVIVADQQIDLELTMSVDDSTPNTGDDVVYTITIVNKGPGNATGVVAVDDLPLDNVILTYISDNPSQGSYDPVTNTWTVGDIPVNGTVTLQIRATVNQTDGSIPSSAQITAANETDIDSTPNNNIPSEDDQDDVLIVLGGVDLAVDKTANVQNANPGDTVIYSIVASNVGSRNATGVVVEDILPPGVEYVSDNSASLQNSSGQPTSYDPDTGDWTIGTLNSGVSRTLRITVTVTDSGGVVVNDADISGDQEDANPGNNNDDAVVNIGGADLSLTKTVDDSSPDENQIIEYTVIVRNSGPNVAQNVQVTDRLPAGVTFVSASPSKGSFTSATGVWIVGELVDEEAATLRIRARVNASGSTVNIAEVTNSDEPDPDSTPNNNNPNEDDYATSVFAFDPPFGIKTFDDSGLPQLQWTMVWVNPGTTPLNVTITDPLADDTEYVFGSLTCSSPGTLVTNTCIYDVAANQVVFEGTLFPSPGATPSTALTAPNRLVISFTVTLADAGTEVFNEATLIGSRGQAFTASVTYRPQEDDDDAAGEVNQPVIDITKSVQPLLALPGEPLTWTITVRNSSTIEANNVVVTDNIPDALDYVSNNPSAGTATVSGQTVTWTIGQLLPGQPQQIEIVTAVTNRVDSALTNIATVDADSIDPRDAAAEVGYVAALADTGETPPWAINARNLLAGVGIVLGATLLLVMRSQR